jgi:hypothetical protein
MEAGSYADSPIWMAERSTRYLSGESRTIFTRFHAGLKACATRQSDTAIRNRLNRLQLFFEKLLVVQIGVVAIEGEQLFMRAQFNDPAVE